MKVRSPMDVALVVREARLTQHMTQADLAERLHVSRAWIIKLEQDGSDWSWGSFSGDWMSSAS